MCLKLSTLLIITILQLLYQLRFGINSDRTYNLVIGCGSSDGALWVCVCVRVLTCACVFVCVYIRPFYVHRIVQQIVFSISWTFRQESRIFQSHMRCTQRGHIDRNMFGKNFVWSWAGCRLTNHKYESCLRRIKQIYKLSNKLEHQYTTGTNIYWRENNVTLWCLLQYSHRGLRRSGRPKLRWVFGSTQQRKVS